MRSVPRTIWALLGLLVVAGFVLSLGKSEDRSHPDSLSYGPSGTRALNELLRASGYRVTSAQTSPTALKPEQTLIVFELTAEVWSSDLPSLAYAEDHPSVVSHLEAGGNVVIVHLRQTFGRMSRSASSGATRRIAYASDASEFTWTVHYGTSPAEWQYDMGYGPAAAPLMLLSDNAFVTLESLYEGRIFRVADGLSATNRFLDLADNASFWLHVIETAGGGARDVVFLDSALRSEGAPGVLSLFGDWARYAWWQLVILFAVIIYTLGKPFGLPEPPLVREGGRRELVDAVATLYKRSAATDVALREVLKNADHLVRKRLNISIDAPPHLRNDNIPEPLAEAFRIAENAVTAKAPPGIARHVANRLLSETEAFLGHKAADRARRRRR